MRHLASFFLCLLQVALSIASLNASLTAGVVVRREQISPRTLIEVKLDTNYCVMFDPLIGTKDTSNCDFVCKKDEFPMHYCPKKTYAVDIWHETERLSENTEKKQNIKIPFLSSYNPTSFSGSPQEFKCITNAYCVPVSEEFESLDPERVSYLQAYDSRKATCAQEREHAILALFFCPLTKIYSIVGLLNYPFNPNCERCEVSQPFDVRKIRPETLNLMKSYWTLCGEVSNAHDFWNEVWEKHGSCHYRTPEQYFEKTIQLFMSSRYHLKNKCEEPGVDAGSGCYLVYKNLLMEDWF